MVNVILIMLFSHLKVNINKCVWFFFLEGKKEIFMKAGELLKKYYFYHWQGKYQKYSLTYD